MGSVIEAWLPAPPCIIRRSSRISFSSALFRRCVRRYTMMSFNPLRIRLVFARAFKATAKISQPCHELQPRNVVVATPTTPFLPPRLTSKRDNHGGRTTKATW